MRSELNALWARVRALQRRFARELAEYRLGPICDDLCDRWFAAWSDHKPLPAIQPFIRRVMDAGYRLVPLGAANNYLMRCLGKNEAPDPQVLLNAIIPPRGKHTRAAIT